MNIWQLGHLLIGIDVLDGQKIIKWINFDRGIMTENILLVP